jgi:Uma2 family endonuclease
MSVATSISVEEYLRTSYSPDREYRDGELVERTVGDTAHADLQAVLAQYTRNRRKKWNIHVYSELRIRAREGWCPIPDIAVYLLPKPEGKVPDRPPFLWIEILSDDDRITEIWEKAKDAIACGTSHVWIVDPNTLESELWTATGKIWITDGTLRLPDSPIVIPLAEAIEE